MLTTILQIIIYSLISIGVFLCLFWFIEAMVEAEVNSKIKVYINDSKINSINIEGINSSLKVHTASMEHLRGENKFLKQQIKTLEKSLDHLNKQIIKLK